MASSTSFAKTILRTAAQESSPKFFISAKGMKGYCVEILRALEQVDPALKFTGDQHFLPFPRILKKLELGELDIFCGLQRNAEREPFFYYIEEPLIFIRGKLVVAADDVVAPVTLEEILKIPGDNSILTIKGTGSASILKKIKKLKVDDTPATVLQALRMLVGKRGRFVFYQDMAIKEAIQQLDLKEKVRILPQDFYYEGLYLGASRHLNSRAVAQLREALVKLRSSGQLLAILEKYPLIRPENRSK